MSSILDSARKLKAEGLVPVPLASPNDQRLDVKIRGKKPIGEEWQKRTTPTDSDLDEWFSVRGYNLGVMTGRVSKIAVFDIDGAEAERVFFTKLQTLPDLDERIKKTRIVKSGSGGFHIYLGIDPSEYPNGFSGTKLVNLGEHAEIAIRGDGQQVVTAPSIHGRTGNVYQSNGKPIQPFTKDEIDRLFALFDKDTNGSITPIADLFKADAVFHDGEDRHGKLRRIIIDLVRNNAATLTMDEIKDMAYEWNKKHCSPPLSDSSFNDRWKSAIKWLRSHSDIIRDKKENDTPSPFADIEPIQNEQKKKQKSKEEEKIDYAVEKIRTQTSFKTILGTDDILYYDGGIYKKGGEAKIREILANEFYGNELKPHITARVHHLIRAYTGTERTEFDKDPTWLHVANGWLNVLDRNFEEDDPDRLSLIKIPPVYDPKATCPNFLKFLRDTVEPMDMADILKFLGYLLLKDCRFESCLMLVGDGANGKSTLINVIRAFLGSDNVISINLHDLIEDHFMASGLFGKMANLAADIGSKKIMETNLFKELVSGDVTRVQEKNKPAFDLKNFAKFIFSANKLPDSDDKSNAFYRRWCVVWFGKTFEGKDRDTKIKEKMTTPEELSGILNMALKGLELLMRDNSFNEDSIEDKRRKYEGQANKLAGFVMDCCDLGADCFIETDKLRAAFKKYCNDKKIDSGLSDQVIGSELQKNYPNIYRKQKRIGKDKPNCYFGISLKGAAKAQSQLVKEQTLLS